jgi:16S rRNA (cytosine1402-N4)-methyltransferase
MGFAMSKYHTPVMLYETLEGLKVNPSGIFVDLTFGGGGHSAAILSTLTSGKLFAFDQDLDARENAKAMQSKNFTFIDSNFRYFAQYLKMHKVTEVDGILADLGVSSHQIDTPERGFSTRFESELDMRMNRDAEKSALTVINEYSEEKLINILKSYGEIQNARQIAKSIIAARIKNKIRTVEELKTILNAFAPRGRESKFFAKIFQGIRIEVNDELVALKEMLIQSSGVLKKIGRLVVISYHSLEDKLVKNFMQSGNFRGELEKDIYGNIIRPFNPVTRKPLVPSQTELIENKRSRSAKLRVAEKN